MALLFAGCPCNDGDLRKMFNKRKFGRRRLPSKSTVDESSSFVLVFIFHCHRTKISAQAFLILLLLLLLVLLFLCWMVFTRRASRYSTEFHVSIVLFPFSLSLSPAAPPTGSRKRRRTNTEECKETAKDLEDEKQHTTIWVAKQQKSNCNSLHHLLLHLRKNTPYI